MEEVNALLEKYDHFRDAKIHSIQAPSDNAYSVTLATLDDDGMEELHHVKLTFTNFKDVRLLENHVLSFIDMMYGVSIIKERDLYGFAIGKCSAMLNVYNAPLYIISSELEVEEIAL
jgi:hypothetical protein